MQSPRLYPLLAAGAACLTLAACGGDDDPPIPQAAVPAQTESTATETAPQQAPPVTTAPDAAAPADGGDAPSAEAPGDSRESGAKTSESDTAQIRDALVSLQEAFAAKDGEKACSLIVGIPKKADPKNPGLSCEALSQGPKMPLPAADRKAAATAKVTVNGNNGTAELAPGVPMKMRKIDGRWRIDYTDMMGSAGAPR